MTSRQALAVQAPASTALTACPPTEGPHPLPFDRHLHAAAARLTSGLSPAGLHEAWLDWAWHLASSPARRLALAQSALSKAANLAISPGAVERDHDPRFRGPGWASWPFNAYASSFQTIEQWWREATTDVQGVTDQHERVVGFAARQILDIFSPSNFIATNPEVLARIAATGGASLAQGALNWVNDRVGVAPDEGPAFTVGREVAATPGEVILRTPLAEVIQYRPTTAEVRKEPVVIIPAWIMKYYILDLTPQDSMVRALVEQGHTVFMVSWKDPEPSDRDRGFDDYRQLGALAAIDAACRITGSDKVHAVGYCLGGTLLSITAAAMARDGDNRLASLTLLAAQADFTEAGELSLFINESQVALLEDLMFERGFLRPEQMAGVFQMLKANDLIWSRLVHEYLMGEPQRTSALDAWSADTTRLPARMESQNLRNLYLKNDLAEGRFCVGGRPVALRDISAPIFALGTETDHIAPWRSVYKLLLLCDTDITYCLTDHGHNVGVVCPPGRGERRRRLRHQTIDGAYLDPQAWIDQTPPIAGSWWPDWFAWLDAHSGPMTAPPPMGAPDQGLAPIEPAPGSYVRRRDNDHTVVASVLA